MTRRTIRRKLSGARPGALAFFWLLTLLVVVGAGTACGGGRGAEGDSESAASGDEAASDASAGEEEDEAVPVELVELARGRIETVLRFSTHLEAEREVEVVSQATGRLKIVQLFVEEGSEVAKGQILLRLEADELETALARTRGQLARAEREYQRQTRLHEQRLISDQAISEATYELDQLKLALQDAERELGYTAVRAPISGTVTQRHVKVGDQVATGQALFELIDFGSIVARVYVPEKELKRVRPGLEARIAAQGAPGEPRLGRVDRIAPRVDPRSGTVKVTVALPRSRSLLPGMFVSVELVTEVNEDAVLVPKKALVYDADQIFVYRVVGVEDDDEGLRVERLKVKARLEDSESIEAGDALAAGDRIVTAGQAGLKDGRRVRPVAGPAAPAPAPGSVPAAEGLAGGDAAATAADAANAAADAAAADAVRRAVRDWARAWQEADVDRYLGSYAEEFAPVGDGDPEQWRRDRRRRLTAPAFIEIGVENLTIEMLGKDRARAEFGQSYRSDRYADRVDKRLELVRRDGRWRIVVETVAD